MGVPYRNYKIDEYVRSTNSKLEISSVVSGKKVEFPAFLTEFSQNFESSWSTEEVYGRNDPIATFQGTKRSISLGFSLPAGNPKAAADNLNDCRTLVQFLYPGYKDSTAKVTVDGKTRTEKLGRVISRAPLVKIKFANLIQGSHTSGEGLLGWISSLSWTPAIAMGYFADGQRLYPKVIDLSISFNALHQHDIGFNDGNSSLAPPFPF